MFFIENSYSYNYQKAYYNKKRRPVGHQAEGGTGVVYVGNVKDIGNYRERLPQQHFFHYKGLAGLISKKGQQGNDYKQQLLPPKSKNWEPEHFEADKPFPSNNNITCTPCIQLKVAAIDRAGIIAFSFLCCLKDIA
jgi:hypothetical protein